MEKKTSASTKTLLIQNLQKQSVLQCLHDIQSPLSGASGYLELMQICLNGDKDLFKIARYRNKVQEGLEELEEILQQISYIYKDHIAENGSALLEFDLNWLLNDVSSNVNVLAKKRDQVVVFDQKSSSTIIQADLILFKLLIYNLIVSVLKSTAKEEEIRLSVENSNKKSITVITTKNIVRTPKELIGPYLHDKGNEDLVKVQSPLHIGAEAIERLNGSINIKEIGNSEVKITLAIPLIVES